MALIINLPDTLRKSVEAATQGRNTVIYTAKGQPCFMYVLPKYTVQSIDASLGTGTHPAFIVDGNEKSEILIGMYQGALLNDEVVSQAGRAVYQTVNFDTFNTKVRQNNNGTTITGWHGITNAEWAALALWCWKNGYLPRGNSAFGRSHAVTTEYGVQESGRAKTDGADATGDERILTGSGPATWRHDATPFGVADLTGNVWEWTYGMRLNAAEINVIENNNAAGATDFAAGSAEWKAIDGTNGNLVAPGSANTVKLAASGTADYTLVVSSGGAFQAMTNPGTNPVAAAALQKLKQLGVYPIASNLTNSRANEHAGYIYHNLTGECVPHRGGGWAYGAVSGVFAVSLYHVRTGAGSDIGSRPAFVA